MTSLDKAREAIQSRIAAGEKAYRNPLEKAAQNPASLRLAINAKCYDCQGRDYDPGVRDRIATCECPDCPLHSVRPYQKKDGSRCEEVAEY